MSIADVIDSVPECVRVKTPPPHCALRMWPGVVLVFAYWAFYAATQVLELPIYARFMSRMAANAVLLLLVTAWWFTNRTVRFGERAMLWSLWAIAGVTAGFLCDRSFGPMGLVFIALPVTLTAWCLWLAVARRMSAEARRWGTVVAVTGAWGLFCVVTMDGVTGTGGANIRLRWTRSAEQVYLAERADAKTNTPAATSPKVDGIELRPGDWAEFRGPLRQGELRGVTIATDWNTAAPKLVWRQRVGPAWSSVLIVDGRLFTQEQRGEEEVLVCLDAATGREIWSHADTTRFSDGQAGAGPRSTPTFADGAIYSLGATGVLNCLDAASGKLRWSRNIANESGAPLPMWGFSSSPLVTDGVVVVYAGGENDKGMLAYDAATGEPMWSVPTGAISYSSPQKIVRNGVTEVTLLSDRGLVAVEAASGKLAWEFAAAKQGIWRAVQPRQIDRGILIGSEDLGLVLVDVAAKDQSNPAELWRSKAMKPAYNDFVVLDGFLYGFDDAVFGCVDLESGKRRWKGGRYGHGQVLLLVDQRLLLVISETGEAVLVAAQPERLEELGRFQAIQGKTWNHPVVAHGRLYVRNDEEIACYDVTAGGESTPR
ncbi:MAG TPA: PQQ-binding-like beta-propeller repeat protein [Pirellulales bacterium]|jgi:outer membrane protein assembly factor BamB|nr:PQQ-binding-like beta-propeller repeat protein [Pirellulales bacterium]